MPHPSIPIEGPDGHNGNGTPCPDCGGDGETVVHADACYANAKCVNDSSCPVTVPCHECGGFGTI